MLKIINYVQKNLIFATGTLFISKLVKKKKTDCYSKPHWFYFYVNDNTKHIKIKCKEVDNQDSFFIMQFENGIYMPLEIKLNSELGI